MNSESTAQILKKAKAKAKLLFSSVPGVEGFGIGDECIRIYVQNAEVKIIFQNS